MDRPDGRQSNIIRVSIDTDAVKSMTGEDGAVLTIDGESISLEKVLADLRQGQIVTFNGVEIRANAGYHGGATAPVISEFKRLPDIAPVYRGYQNEFLKKKQKGRRR